MVVPETLARMGTLARYSKFGKLAPHLRFIERKSRKLAREIFHGMVVHGPRLQNKQRFLFRIIDVSNELFAMAASIARAEAIRKAKDEHAREAIQLVDTFCQRARRQVKSAFKALWDNDDGPNYKTARAVLDGRYDWVSDGITPLEELLARKPEKPLAVASENESTHEERLVSQ